MKYPTVLRQIILLVYNILYPDKQLCQEAILRVQKKLFLTQKGVRSGHWTNYVYNIIVW